VAESEITYTPPPTVRQFILDRRPGELFYDWIVGPVGSGKTTGLFFKLVYLAKLQEPSPDGIRRSRAVVVRNTMPQLKDTTLASWAAWFKDGQAGKWDATNSKFLLRFADVECEVLFRPLDTPDDVARVLSLEVTFAILDEFVQIPRAIVDALSGRVGRYPAAKDGGATHFGMWGASNTDTEDNWWFGHLHGALEDNSRYFVQPSGLSPAAENLENLPGKRGYYINLKKDKSKAWIKQFIDAEWGFSAAGKPVVGSFQPDLHQSHGPVKFNRHLPLVVGVDPGLTGSAFIFGQEDLNGRLMVLGELVQSGMGIHRLMTERVKPYIRHRFPEADVVLAPDPAAANRSSNDERTAVDIMRRHFRIKLESNNRLPLRLTAIEHYTTRLTDLGPALQIDAQACPMLLRALKGGWRFEMDVKKDQIKHPTPEKNPYSHPGDAFGYLCRYYHRQSERGGFLPGGRRVPLPPPVANAYHFR
jgi:hypothetical protein